MRCFNYKAVRGKKQVQSLNLILKNNDNVVNKLTLANNDIVKDNILVNSKKNAKDVEQIASKIMSKLGNENSWRFYCLVAYKLPEHKIWLNLEMATTGKAKSAGGLFNWLCRRDMGTL